MTFVTDALGNPTGGQRQGFRGASNLGVDLRFDLEKVSGPAASLLAAAPRLSDPINVRKVRADLSIYLLSGSEDPVGQQLAGLHVLIERYRKAGIDGILHDLYPGGRHEMLNEINLDEVRAPLLGWIDARLIESRTSRRSNNDSQESQPSQGAETATICRPP